MPLETGVTESDVSLLRRALIYLPAALPLVACAVVGSLVYRRQTVSFLVKILLVAGLALAGACIHGSLRIICSLRRPC